MLKNTQTLRYAALGALVLGFACAGFVASASADDVISNDAAKDITNAADAAHSAPSPGPAAGTAHGNTPGVVHAYGAGGGTGVGIGSGGNPTGEGALLEGNCFADMAVYNKQGKFVGRGIVNTCN